MKKVLFLLLKIIIYKKTVGAQLCCKILLSMKLTTNETNEIPVFDSSSRVNQAIP